MHRIDWLYKASRWALGGVFIYAGSLKLWEPQVFAVLIEAFGIVPDPLLMPVAVALPALEVIAGLGLVFDIEGSLSIISGLLALFIAILGYGIRMGLDVDCGCFGPEEPEARAFHGLRTSLYRDLAMAAGVVFMCVWRRFRSIRPVRIRMIVNKLAKKRSAEDAYV